MLTLVSIVNVFDLANAAAVQEPRPFGRKPWWFTPSQEEYEKRCRQGNPPRPGGLPGTEYVGPDPIPMPPEAQLPTIAGEISSAEFENPCEINLK